MYAVSGGYRRIVELLIYNGADVDIEDIQGRTVLSISEDNGHALISSILIEAGAQ